MGPGRQFLYLHTAMTPQNAGLLSTHGSSHDSMSCQNDKGPSILCDTVGRQLTSVVNFVPQCLQPTDVHQFVMTILRHGANSTTVR